MAKKKVSEKTITNKVIRANHLDFLYYELYLKGIDLSEEQMQLLEENDYIEKKEKPKKSRKKSKIASDLSVKGEHSRKADEHIDIVDDSREKLFEGGRDIKREDWLPKSILEHTQEFVEWIDSINGGFQGMKPYKPFLLYCQQADVWLSENDDITNYSATEDKQEYAYQEFNRCEQNTLYALDKYLMLKEGDMTTGSRRYISKPVHKVICFLTDCGYSYMMGKPRQIAATSTIGGIAMVTSVFKRNFFQKFITMDEDSGEEIFEDKIKYPFSELPVWMKPNVLNERDNLFALGTKEKKGTRGGVNSKIKVDAPSVSAINGGSPNRVLIDEAGYIKILGKMMKEARPTMFVMNDETGKLEMKRQIIIWGTGGEMDKGGKAYESEYMGVWDDWKKRDFATGIVPIFFDWTTRPGITKEHYEQEKKAYTVEGPDKETKAIQFRQHYPSTVEDMFLTSAKTLISIEYINERVEKIYDIPHEQRAKHGYFLPVYDENHPENENSDTPYKIIGAQFVETEDGDPRASTTIFMEPKKKWKNRYYMGTDPISSDNGFSRMSSSIWDDYYKTVPAIVDYRDDDHKYTFLQCLLLGIYYRNEGEDRCKELLEANIGTTYADYVESKGYYNSLVYRTELPEYLRGGAHLIGIDNRGRGSGTNNRSRMIVNKMHEMISAFGNRIFIETFWRQMKTFVCTITDRGNEVWGTTDKRKYPDDVPFGMTFAYICSLCYEHLVPENFEAEQSRFKVRYELRRDGNGNLTRVPVKKRVA